MRPFAKGTLPLVLLAGILSAVAGYGYGVHSAQHASAFPERRIAIDPAAYPHAADLDVLAAAPSWVRWPQLTDF
jgi:hypothetical protein